jgi:hypothetical protein
LREILHTIKLFDTSERVIINPSRDPKPKQEETKEPFYPSHPTDSSVIFNTITQQRAAFSQL